MRWLMMGFMVTARLGGGIAHLIGWVETQLSQGVALSKLGLDPAYHGIRGETEPHRSPKPTSTFPRHRPTPGGREVSPK